MRGLKLFALLLPVFLILDLSWLGILMKSFYSSELGELARRQGESFAPRWGAAILVYLLIPGGLVLFVRPLIGAHAATWQAIVWGAVYGLILYGVYDLTNLAVLEKWTLKMTLADVAWGCTLCAVVSACMRLIDGWLGN